MLLPLSMSNFIVLPDGTLLNLNGATLGEFIYTDSAAGMGFLTYLFLQQAHLVMAMTLGRSDIHMRTTQI
jgi:hypothetical protein